MTRKDSKIDHWAGQKPWILSLNLKCSNSKKKLRSFLFFNDQRQLSAVSRSFFLLPCMHVARHFVPGPRHEWFLGQAHQEEALQFDSFLSEMIRSVREVSVKGGKNRENNRLIIWKSLCGPSPVVNRLDWTTPPERLPQIPKAWVWES